MVRLNTARALVKQLSVKLYIAAASVCPLLLQGAAECSTTLTLISCTYLRQCTMLDGVSDLAQVKFWHNDVDISCCATDAASLLV